MIIMITIMFMSMSMIMMIIIITSPPLVAHLHGLWLVSPLKLKCTVCWFLKVIR